MDFEIIASLECVSNGQYSWKLNMSFKYKDMLVSLEDGNNIITLSNGVELSFGSDSIMQIPARRIKQVFEIIDESGGAYKIDYVNINRLLVGIRFQYSTFALKCIRDLSFFFQHSFLGG